MRRHRAVRASPALLRRSGARLLPSLARKPDGGRIKIKFNLYKS